MFIAPTPAEKLLAKINNLVTVADQRFIATGAIMPPIETALTKEMPKAEKPIYRAASEPEMYRCDDSKKPYINYWI